MQKYFFPISVKALSIVIILVSLLVYSISKMPFYLFCLYFLFDL